MAGLLEEFNNFSNVLQAIVDHTSLIAHTDDKGDINYVNDKFCEISKYNRDELIGKNHRILKSGHHPDRFFSDLWKTILSGKVWSGEIKNRAKDGSFYWVLATIAPDKEHSQYVSIQQDISEKKILEDKIGQLECDLNHAVSERETRERFLATLGHDLRTPLTIAKLAAQTLEKKYAVTDRVKKLSSKITDNINRIDDMMTGLLIDTCQKKALLHIPPELTEIDMESVIRETIDNLKIIHGDRFIFDFTGKTKGFWSASSIKRILENLATNAIKYGDQLAPVTILIEDRETHCTISVHNRGKLISESDQEIIFNYLQRTSEAKTSTQNGWGLGLAAVKSMVEAHGGSVKVISSKTNDGTTFIVTLPKDSRPFTNENVIKESPVVIANEGSNYLRLFRHMPEIQVILSGPKHKFEYVNEAYVETFGFNATGMTVRDLGPTRENYISILDEVYQTGTPKKLIKNPIVIAGQTRYLNQTFVPRKNSAGEIIGILSISSEACP
jgi:PAS domain S-box-containing protein